MRMMIGRTGSRFHDLPNTFTAYLLLLLFGVMGFHRVYLFRTSGLLMSGAFMFSVILSALFNTFPSLGVIFMFVPRTILLGLFLMCLMDLFRVQGWVKQYRSQPVIRF